MVGRTGGEDTCADMPDNTSAKGIGERIKARRVDLGMAQEDLSAAVGCRVTQVSRWERGLNTPVADALIQLTQVLRVSAAWLLTGEEARLEAVMPDGPTLPRDEILLPDPDHPGWAEFLEEARYLARSLPDWALQAVKHGPPQMHHNPPAEAYIELAEAYKRVQDGRMTVGALGAPPKK